MPAYSPGPHKGIPVTRTKKFHAHRLSNRTREIEPDLGLRGERGTIRKVDETKAGNIPEIRKLDGKLTNPGYNVTTTLSAGS